MADVKRSPMRPFPVPVGEDGQIVWSSLTRHQGLGRGRLAVVRADAAPVTPIRRQQRTPIKPVSDKRRAENRQRRAMVNALYPERPGCGRPGCPRLADDIHEPLTRARGGSITDPGNQVPLCRPCHDEVTFRPESELGWAYEIGLLRHSWDGPAGDAA